MSKLFKSIIAGLLALTLLVTVGYAAVGNFTKQVLIGEEAAKTIALNHAEKTIEEVTFLKVELERDKKVTKYEVEFYAGDLEYDYDIDAVTGKILSFDYEVETKKPVAPVAPTQPQPPVQPTQPELITEAKAKEIALAHAGVKEADATFLKVELDRDDKVTEYEVEFYVGNKEYDYEINAVTGEIMKFDYEVETQKPVTPVAPTQPQPPVQPTQPELITEAKAKEIALAHAGVKEADATYVKVEFDMDKRVSKYEVEFFAGNTEYDYEINAVTGEILEFDYEVEKTKPVAPAQPTQPEQPTQPTYITVEKAKEIALAHAGVTASQVKFKEAKFDYDDGMALYEIEFKVGKVEYEYEIDATTGNVVKCEIDD